MKELTDTIEQMNAELEAVRVAYQEKAGKILNRVFVEFFEQNPEAKAVGWNQYTPYFNDGEECIFRCNVDYAWVTNANEPQNVQYGEYDGDDEDAVWIDDADYGSFNEELMPAGIQEATEKLRNTLRKLDDSVFKDVFGDHAKIIATRDGFEILEYEHD